MCPQQTTPKKTVLRIREHVNPLSRKYQQPVEPPDWQRVYAAPSQPLHVDIGCGWGKFLLEMAHLQPNWNFLGLEIREPLVEQANQWAQAMGLMNVYYLFCNVNSSLRPVLQSLPPNVLHCVTVQFPDPWFKRRHGKRRVLQPEMVTVLAESMVSEGTLFIQSDIEAVAREMHNFVVANVHFQRQHTAMWLADNPFPVPTEREMATLAQGYPVYRSLFRRVSHHRSFLPPPCSQNNGDQ